MAFTPLRHACFYLAHPELSITYQQVLGDALSKSDNISYQVLSCGLDFELRSPNSHSLGKIYKQLSPAGQDILHIWTWIFLFFNRVQVSKRQSILACVEMTNNIQLLLEKGSD
jgi:hypothetical protein